MTNKTTEMEQLIIQYLKKCPDSWAKALQIAKAVGKKTTKEINHTLYAMEKGKILRKLEDSSPGVTWQLVDCHTPSDVSADGPQSRATSAGSLKLDDQPEIDGK
jgi:hypothetical protein